MPRRQWSGSWISRRQRKRIILQVEGLEGRCLPSTSGILKVDLVQDIDPPMASETQAVLAGAGLSTASTASSVASQYQIALRYTDNSVTDSQKAIFAQAAARWGQIITGDVPDAYISSIGLVDDLSIDVSAPSIDGNYGILGQAGPTYLRSDSYLPIAGVIKIDNADMARLEASGQLYAVALHEMGHVLGFGTIWSLDGLLSGAGGPDPRFLGAQATAAYQAMFNTTESSVPVENLGGSGTADSHWRESVFGNELMTGYLNSGINPISRVTVASLADMGYTVNMNAADVGNAVNTMTVVNLASADVTVQADLTVAANSNAGLITHYLDVNNYYLGRLCTDSNGITTAEIWRRFGGNMSLLGSAYVGTSAGTLRFEVVGPSLKLFLDDNLVAFAFDSQIGAGKIAYSGTEGTPFESFNAAPITPTTLALGTADPFNQAQAAPGSQLDRNWQEQSGNFKVAASNTAVGQGGLNLAVLNNINQADVGVQANVNANNAVAGLVARYGGVGDTNMYFGTVYKLNGNYVASIWRNLNGNWVQLNTPTILAGSDGVGTLRFEAVGSSLKLFWDENGGTNFSLVAFVNDTALTTGTVGMRTTAGVSVDNLVANTITSTTYTLGSTEDFSAGSGVGNQLSRNWRDQVGDSTLQGGAAAGQGGLNLSTLNNINQADVSVQANVNANNAVAGLVARYSGVGDTNMYFGTVYKLNGNYVASIWRNLNGNWVQLNTPTILAGSDGVGTLRFEVVGSSLKLFWDENGGTNFSLVAFVNDTALTTGTVGMRTTTGVSVDNFVANTITSTTYTLGSTEDFSVGSGNQLSRNWRDQVGDLTIQGGAAVGQGGLNVAVLNNINQADVSVQANVNANNAVAGLVARYSGVGDTNMYFGTVYKLNGNYVASIWRNVNGNWVQLNTPTVLAGSDGVGTLRFEVVGSSLKLFWDENGGTNFSLVAFVNDTALTTGTVGMRTTAGVSVDNFVANTLTSTTYTLGSTEDFSAGSGIGNQLSRNWRDQVGDFTIQGGAAVGQAGLNLSTLNNINQADVSVQASVNANNAVAGLVARYSGVGDTNMYFGTVYKLNGNYVASIWRNVNGNWVQLNTPTVLASSDGVGTLRFEVVGSSLKLFWDENGGTNFSLVAFANDTSLTTGTVGMRTTAGVSVDNFVANTITSTTYTLGSTEDFSSGSGVGNQLSRNWRDQAGDYTIQGGVAVGQTSLNLAVLNNINQADVSVQADVNANNAVAGLVARYSGVGDNNMYFGAVYKSGSNYVAAIWRNLNGTWTRLTTPATLLDSNGIGTLKFVVTGSSLTLSWKENGSGSFTQIQNITDTALTTGSAGIRTTSGASIDSFSIS